MEQNTQHQTQPAPAPEQPRRKKVYYTGHFFDYFIKSIGLLILCVFTLGILFPYFVYWNAKYFVNNLEIEA